MAAKATKCITLPIDKMQKLDQLAVKGGMKFNAALEVIIDYGLREYERKTGAEIRA